MLRVISSNIRSALLPENIKLHLNNTEHSISRFIKDACKVMPQQPIMRICGGWVRDKLLGIPSKDIDITVDTMSGIEFAEALKWFAQNSPNYRGQKVIGVVKSTEERPEQIKNLAVAFLKIFGQEVEILSLRGHEVYEEGSRNPISISKATAEEDAFRRDLTINALFYNINTQRIEDFTGKGYDDLATMTLRTPLDPIKTFQDDPLRLLRVLRFHSRYGQSAIAPEVVEAMHDPGVQYQITRKIANPVEERGIVVERTAEELRKIMLGNQPEAAIRIMYQTGLLQKVLNLPLEFHPMNMDQRSRHHQLNIIDHTVEVLKNANRLSKEFKVDDQHRMLMNFTALFHDFGKLDPRSHKEKPTGELGFMGDPNNPQGITHEQSSSDIWMNFAKALKFSDEEQRIINDWIANHMNPHSHVELNEGVVTDRQLRRYIRKNPSWVYQYIHAMADAMSKTQEPDEEGARPYRENLERIRQLAPDADSFGNQAPATDLLNGKEIMDMVGLPPAPPPGLPGYIEMVKERIREEQDVNPSLTKDQAIQIVQQMLVSGELNAYHQV